MLKPSLVFDCPAIVKDTVTENAQPVLLPHASEVLWTLEYEPLAPYDRRKFELEFK